MKSNVSFDFKEIFEGLPGAYLILSPDFMILAATNAYVAVALRRRDQIVGLNLFEAFPDNPDDPTADGVAKLTQSLNKVLETKKPHAMPVQRYDIALPENLGGGFGKRYWRPSNFPILNSERDIVYIVHQVEEVTNMVEVLEAAMDKEETQRQQQRSS